MGGANEALFDAATYATIHVTFDADEITYTTDDDGVTTRDPYPMVRLFDWDDAISSGYLNYWNFETDTGDIVDHVSRYTDPSNLQTMRIANPSGLGNLFNNGVPGL
ncbi:unnamed protein product, partial [marine sediment metagenome]